MVYTGHETVIWTRKRPNSTQPYSRQIKQKFGQISILQLSLPSIAADYNDRMNAVDIADHIKSIIRPRHRQRRGPARALTWDFLLLTALANSSILQLRGSAKLAALSITGPVAQGSSQRDIQDLRPFRLIKTKIHCWGHSYPD
jgi:hypothetical protein